MALSLRFAPAGAPIAKTRIGSARLPPILIPGSRGCHASRNFVRALPGGSNFPVTWAFAQAAFRNPINSGPDPFLAHHKGHYYLTTTQGNAIRIWKSPTLGGLKQNSAVTVWTDRDSGRCCNIWASGFHLLDGPGGGRGYLYYTAVAAKKSGKAPTSCAATAASFFFPISGRDGGLDPIPWQGDLRLHVFGPGHAGAEVFLEAGRHARLRRPPASVRGDGGALGRWRSGCGDIASRKGPASRRPRRPLGFAAPLDRCRWQDGFRSGLAVTGPGMEGLPSRSAASPTGTSRAQGVMRKKPFGPKNKKPRLPGVSLNRFDLVFR
jgi:hypothetical protein